MKRLKTAYLTYTINEIQTQFGLTPEEVKCKLYLDALLFEKPIVHFGFILGSFTTMQVFLEQPELVSDGIVVISSEFKDLEETLRWILFDKFEIKRRELKTVGINYAKKQHLRLELFADKLDLSVTTREELAKSVTEMLQNKNPRTLWFPQQDAINVFKSSLMHLVKNKHVHGIEKSTKSLNLLTEIVEKGTYFEPSWTKYLITKLASARSITLSKAHVDACCEVVNVSYFLAGASQTKGEISADSRLYRGFLNRFASTTTKVTCSSEIFKQLFSIYGFDPSAIVNLSLDSLKALRKDPLTHALREKIASLEKEGLTDKLTELKEAIDSELKQVRRITLTKYFFRGTLYFIELLTQIPMLGYVADPLIEYLIKRYGGAPIFFFFTELYPKKMRPKAKSQFKTS